MFFMNFTKNNVCRQSLTSDTCSCPWAVLAASFLALCSVASALDIKRGSITWTLVGTPTHGTYVNGDPWVVGPVTITNISPASVSDPRIMHGSMLNPKAGVSVKQGFDSDNDVGYDDSLNVGRPGGNPISAENPLVIVSGSLLSSQSITAASQRPQIQEIQILTVVSAPPPANSFRPPYCGDDKTHRWTKSELDYSALLALAPVANTPNLNTLASKFNSPWIEINTDAAGRDIHPKSNMPDYGRDMGYLISDALLSLHLNYTPTQKEPLLISIVQYGIDIYGAAVNGGLWQANGGHNQSRKAPMLFAGRLLNDSEILSRGNRADYNIFQCDLQMFYVSQADVDLPRYTADGRPRNPYTVEMIGTPEWGEKHNIQPQRDGSNWGVSYRSTAGSSVVGGVLAAKLMGLESIWNNPVVFDYYRNRYVPIEAPKASNNLNSFQLFHANMWAAYADLKPPSLPQPQPSSGPQSPLGLHIQGF